MGRNYERLSIEVFGRELIKTNDLDPIYNALVGLKTMDVYTEDQIDRWMIAYWCFYHAGVASFMSEYEGEEYWDWMLVAAKNETECPGGGRWPRGGERRHFRGDNALKSLAYMKKRWKHRPEDMVNYIIDQPGGAPLTFKAVSNRVQEHVGFGPWIGFKVADMVDRVLGHPVSFEAAEVFMFKDPEKAAMMLWEEREGHKYLEGAKPKRDKVLTAITDYLMKEFNDLPAPPLQDRAVNIQEVETVLCKWKSHMNGHYPLMNDITEIRHGLSTWHARAARDFLSYMPEENTDG